MPDVLSLKTPHFELAVWTKDITRPQAMLGRTLAHRAALPVVTELRFQPALQVQGVTPSLLALPSEPLALLKINEALFFENKQYEFEFCFRGEVDTSIEPMLLHRLAKVQEAFHYKRGALRGNLDFGNDIGWFRLGVQYTVAGQRHEQFISFEVQPTKMAMAADLELMHQAVDVIYPLWRFSFAQKTELELAKSRKPHERFPLLWLAHFERLRHDLARAAKIVCRAPHARLLPYTRQMRAERLHGRLMPKLEEQLAQDLRANEGHRHYPVTGRRLAVDTPENRFVKMVLTRSSQDLAKFMARAHAHDKAPEQDRLSETFYAELTRWKQPFDQLLRQPFLAEVGAYEGLAAESLVLHQRAGYAAVYRIWQELKLYLDVLGQHANISMKSIAELYEVWCFLALKQMLETLGFTEQVSQRAILRDKGLEKALEDGMGAAFQLERDGIKIRLAHEPSFSRSKNPTAGKIYSWTTRQRPDIFLEATFPSGERVQWVFDAKYRIAHDETNEVDKAPDGAIDQMHRYRDALIYMSEASDKVLEKRRPVLGAFVLYPGWFVEEAEENPHADEIAAVAIGAFPLLPGRDNRWLFNFLAQRFGNASGGAYRRPEADQYFVEDSTRIATLGMALRRYDDLTLTAAMGPNRSTAYVNDFKSGQAKWYHTPLETTDRNIQRHAMRELRYCAIGVPTSGSARAVSHIYEVKSVTLVKRCDLSLAQTGTPNKPEDQREFWLLELGHAQALSQSLSMPMRSHKFHIQLTSALALQSVKRWEELPERYALVSLP